MILMARLFAIRLFCVALAGLAVASCTITAKGPGGEIAKVKYYCLQPQEILRTNDAGLQFERQHYLWGAYTAAEQIARTGSYYTVMWKAYDRTQPVTVRFEYRQEKTALTVKTLEQQVTDLRRHNQNEFKVVGTEFTEGGHVTAWRVTLLRGKEELASQNSFLWK